MRSVYILVYVVYFRSSVKALLAKCPSVQRQPEEARALPGTCVGGGFKGGDFEKHVIASSVCVAAVLFAMSFSASYSILNPPPMKQPPTQVPT